MTFAEQIHAARTRLGLTQDQLAAMLLVSKQSISNWECNRSKPCRAAQRRYLAACVPVEQPRETIADRILHGLLPETP